ncbi:MAG TPA: UvrB/UvrC motif-containing protein [Kiritimatiellia bacterium]|nr:UvrB/UvrC motif-containing protein [Kiritimatiellia bacterium]
MRDGMLCEICKTEEATVHLTQVIDGSIKKLHLCEQCAQSNGFDLQGPISITDILLGMGGKREETAKPVVERSCPRCHMRRTDFKKTGRFGCAQCYETFAEDLPPLLKAMHRNDRHIGKVPIREADRLNAMNELNQLQADLEQAISNENYETAATLRDQIMVCRQKLSGEG